MVGGQAPYLFLIMIVNNNIQSTESVGEISQNSVTIDPKNINHIIQILSSNLYSNPIRSFLREIVSNAYDSHVEAGSNEPIIITITDSVIAIRDFGTGISPEKFRDIYLCIGSSTKRESNEYLGYFGIGRFSALACSNVVNVTNFYEGKKYCYVMLKDTNSLRIDSIGVFDTDEKNGLEVRIPVQDEYKYIKELETLSFFNNIYINGHGKDFNDRKIYSYKNFRVCSYTTRDRPTLLLGNVLYDLDLSYFPNMIWTDCFKKISVTAEIGKVDVTPNREQLIYSQRTINYISELLKNTKNELLDIAAEKFNKDYTSLLEVYDVVDNMGSFEVGDKSIYIYDRSVLNSREISYKGKKYNGLFMRDALSLFFNYSIKEIKTTNWRSKNATLKWILRHDNIIRVPSNTPVNSKYLKKFFDDKYSDYEIFKSFTAEELKWMWKEMHKYRAGEKKELYIMKEAVKELNNKIKEVDVYNSKEFKDYREELIKEMKESKKGITAPINIAISQYDRYVTTRDYKISSEEQLSGLTRYKKVLWTFKRCDEINEINSLFYALGNKNIILVLITKTALSSFKIPDSWTAFEDYILSDYKVWVSMSMHYLRLYKNIKCDKIRSMLPYLPSNIVKIYDAYTDIKGMGYVSTEKPLFKRVLKCRGINSDVENLCNNIMEIEEVLKKAAPVTDLAGFNPISLFMCMKKKYFRINYKTYKKVKEL